MNKILFLFFIFYSCAHAEISHEDDRAKINSGIANSPEVDVWIGVPLRACIDIDNYIGACTKRHNPTQNLNFRIQKNYQYKFQFQCTGTIKANFGNSIQIIEANKIFDFYIPQSEFNGVNSFICRGSIYPMDRPEYMNSFFEARIILVDPQYERMTDIYLEQTNIIVGSYAHHVKVYVTNWNNSMDDVSFSSPSSRFCVITESYMMRETYFCKGMHLSDTMSLLNQPMPGEWK